MKALLDVNILLACGWKHHPFHEECRVWLKSLDSYTLCPIVELGFIRISMSPAFGASHEDALTVLQSISRQPQATQIPCDQTLDYVPKVTSYKDTTDAYLVHLAQAHGHLFATLDAGIINKAWANNIAFNPMTAS